MKKHYIFVMFAASLTLSAAAQDELPPKPKISIEQERALVQKRELAYLIAPIKNGNDLQIYLNSSNFQASPLRYLSDGARDRFLSSLTFNEKGLTGFHYEDLQAELTYSQIYQLLALFGAQEATAAIKGAKSTSSLDGVISTMSDGAVFIRTIRIMLVKLVQHAVEVMETSV